MPDSKDTEAGNMPVSDKKTSSSASKEGLPATAVAKPKSSVAKAKVAKSTTEQATSAAETTGKTATKTSPKTTVKKAAKTVVKTAAKTTVKKAAKTATKTVAKTAAGKPAAKSSKKVAATAAKTTKTESAAKTTKSATVKTANSAAAKASKRSSKKSSYLRFRLRAFDSRLLDRAAAQIAERAVENGATVRGPIPLPVRFSRTTILISPHKYKDARDQYEIRTYSRLIDIHHLDQTGVTKLSSLDLPAGVNFKAEIRQ